MIGRAKDDTDGWVCIKRGIRAMIFHIDLSVVATGTGTSTVRLFFSCAYHQNSLLGSAVISGSNLGEKKTTKKKTIKQKAKSMEPVPREVIFKILISLQSTCYFQSYNRCKCAFTDSRNDGWHWKFKGNSSTFSYVARLHCISMPGDVNYTNPASFQVTFVSSLEASLSVSRALAEWCLEGRVEQAGRIAKEGSGITF